VLHCQLELLTSLTREKILLLKQIHEPPTLSVGGPWSPLTSSEH
jgi:hypothetical protein